MSSSCPMLLIFNLEDEHGNLQLGWLSISAASRYAPKLINTCVQLCPTRKMRHLISMLRKRDQQNLEKLNPFRYHLQLLQFVG
jgi:hypothetical protein